MLVLLDKLNIANGCYFLLRDTDTKVVDFDLVLESKFFVIEWYVQRSDTNTTLMEEPHDYTSTSEAQLEKEQIKKKVVGKRATSELRDTY